MSAQTQQRNNVPPPAETLPAKTGEPPKPTLATVNALLEKYRSHIQMALTGNKQLTPERMIRVALTAISQSEKLMMCDPLTICGSIIQSALLGLEPSSVLGECFLVPFWNKKARGGKGGYEAQLIVGYQGKIKLVSNTGDLLGVKASPVRQNDEFDFDDGISPTVRHKYVHIKDRGPVVGFWAGAALRNGFSSVAYMTVQEVEQHRDMFAMTRDRNGKIFGVWIENFEAMALKTVIHKCLKYVPKSAIAQTAWNLDERAEAGLSQQFSADVPLELMPTPNNGSSDEAPDEARAVQMPQRKSETAALAEPDKIREDWLMRFRDVKEAKGEDFYFNALKQAGYTSETDIPTEKMKAVYDRL